MTRTLHEVRGASLATLARPSDVLAGRGGGRGGGPGAGGGATAAEAAGGRRRIVDGPLALVQPATLLDQ